MKRILFLLMLCMHGVIITSEDEYNDDDSFEHISDISIALRKNLVDERDVQRIFKDIKNLINEINRKLEPKSDVHGQDQETFQKQRDWRSRVLRDEHLLKMILQESKEREESLLCNIEEYESLYGAPQEEKEEKSLFKKSSKKTKKDKSRKRSSSAKEKDKKSESGRMKKSKKLNDNERRSRSSSGRKIKLNRENSGGGTISINPQEKNKERGRSRRLSRQYTSNTGDTNPLKVNHQRSKSLVRLSEKLTKLTED